MAVGDKTRYGVILAEWQVPEYIKYERSLLWYIVAGGIGLVMFIQALINLNFLFAIILGLIATIVYLHDRRHPDLIDFLILDTGVAFGQRYYPYKELDSFWVVYEPPDTKILYFGLRRAFRYDLPIHLEAQNPITIRNILLNYLQEDLSRESQSTEERLGQIMKL